MGIHDVAVEIRALLQQQAVLVFPLFIAGGICGELECGQQYGSRQRRGGRSPAVGVEILAVHFSPGRGLAAGIHKHVLVVGKVLREAVHRVRDDFCKLRIFRAEYVVGEFVDKEVSDDLIRRGIAFIYDVLNTHVLTEQVVPETLRNRTRGVNPDALEILVVHNPAAV